MNLIIEFYDTGRMDIWETGKWTTCIRDGSSDRLVIKNGKDVVGMYHICDICRAVVVEGVDESERDKVKAMPVLRW